MIPEPVATIGGHTGRICDIMASPAGVHLQIAPFATLLPADARLMAKMLQYAVEQVLAARAESGHARDERSSEAVDYALHTDGEALAHLIVYNVSVAVPVAIVTPRSAIDLARDLFQIALQIDEEGSDAPGAQAPGDTAPPPRAYPHLVYEDRLDAIEAILRGAGLHRAECSHSQPTTVCECWKAK